MLIFLAARYSRLPELNVYRTQLEAAGHRVTSRWLNGGHEIVRDVQGLSAQVANAERERLAIEDWNDMKEAEVVVSFTEEPRSTNGRGGRHVEFGGALALGKTCVVVGPRENVFHHLPGLQHHSTWAEFMRSWFPETS